MGGGGGGVSGTGLQKVYGQTVLGGLEHCSQCQTPLQQIPCRQAACWQGHAAQGVQGAAQAAGAEGEPGVQRQGIHKQKANVMRESKRQFSDKLGHANAGREGLHFLPAACQASMLVHGR